MIKRPTENTEIKNFVTDHKLVIMQPYIFPYIGYFQMVNLADTFMFYDDVNFIKKGWINRNNILSNKKALLFSIPLANASQNKLINEVEVAIDQKWKQKFLKTLEQSYKKAPNYSIILPLIEEVLNKSNGSIAEMAQESIKVVANYLNFNTKFKISSVDDTNQSLKGQERILAICKREKTNHYINAIGGKELYNKELFASHSIKLNFIETQPINYKQFTAEFTPYLSIIDPLMFLEKNEVCNLLNNYELV